MIYRQLLADGGKLEECGSPTTATPTPPTSTSPSRPGRPATSPRPRTRRPGVNAFIALDWQDNLLVGIEILDADIILPPAILDQAEHLE